MSSRLNLKNEALFLRIALFELLATGLKAKLAEGLATNCG